VTPNRKSRGHPKRKTKIRLSKTTVLIQGEEKETEPNYFNGLRKDGQISKQFKVTVKKGPGYSAINIIRKAIKHIRRAKSRGEDYDEVWCVLDVESPSRRKSLNDALELAEANDITTCLSNPCFEVWFLSHFERKATAYPNCSAVVRKLDKYWHNNNFQKGDKNTYERLASKTGKAINYAMWIREKHHGLSKHTADCNSSTDVYKLVQYLVANRN
jgi:hypothetical protein